MASEATLRAQRQLRTVPPLHKLTAATHRGTGCCLLPRPHPGKERSIDRERESERGADMAAPYLVWRSWRCSCLTPMRHGCRRWCARSPSVLRRTLCGCIIGCPMRFVPRTRGSYGEISRSVSRSRRTLRTLRATTILSRRKHSNASIQSSTPLTASLRASRGMLS